MGQGGRGGHGEACGRGVRGPAFGGDVAGEVAVRFGRGSSTPHSRNHPPGNVARGVAPQFPAGIDAPALEKTIRPTAQLRRRCYLPGARWAPARPIQISSAAASTPAFWSHLAAGSVRTQPSPPCRSGHPPDPSKSRVQVHRPPPFWSHLTAGSLDVALPTVPRGGPARPVFSRPGVDRPATARASHGDGLRAAPRHVGCERPQLVEGGHRGAGYTRCVTETG